MRLSFQATLTCVVFAAGVGTLATEIAASRLLAPYFGNSTIVWANVIGLTLASLSVGYWLGGRLADRYPTPRALGLVVAAAACLVAFATLVARPILDLSVEGLDRVSAGAAIGSFFGVLVLFVPPVTLMGMVAPFAIRLAIRDIETAGTVSGRLYAVSTVGSLLGTFLAALVAIPAIGTQRTLLAAAALIGASGAVLLGRRWLLLTAGLAALLLIPPGAVKGQSGVLFEDESRYQFIQVVEEDGVRRLYLDEGLATHSVWREDDVLTGGVWDTYVAVVDLLGRQPERVAMLGNAAGTAARAFARYYRGVQIDGVELDPAVSDAGRKYFEMGEISGLAVHDADARAYLRRTDRALRRDHRRCVPPALRPVLPRNGGVLRACPGPAPPGRDRRARTWRRRPTTTTLRGTSEGPSHPCCRGRTPGSRSSSTRSSSARTVSRPAASA